MQWRTGIRIVALMGMTVLAMALFSACGGGVAQKDYDAVKQQLAAREADVKKAQDQVAAKEKEIADLKLSQTQVQQRNPLIWTETKPLPPPAPTATPVPPGFVPPPAATPPPDLVNEVVPFTFYIEHLTGHQTSNIVQSPSCVPNSQFRRGAHLVWRFEVIDTSTGKRLTSLDKDVTIKLILPNKEEKTARYSKRGGVGAWMWSFAWDVPSDYPLGALDYQIVVTKGNRTGTFDQDSVALVRPPATPGGPPLSDSRVQIVQ